MDYKKMTNEELICMVVHPESPIGEELARRLEAKDGGWVSVKERLPEGDDGFFMIATTEDGRCSEDSNIDDPVEFANPVFIRANKDEGWFTHWRPLPAPPKEEDV